MANGLNDIDTAWTNGTPLPKWFEQALSVPREEGFVEVDGVPIHYLRWGDRTKPPVLMTHGFLAHARCFAFIAPLFAADYDIVAYDLSGMGDSGARDHSDDETRAREMIGVARELGLFEKAAKPIVVAHSFGARIGVKAVTISPDSFGGLIACDLMVLSPEAQAALWASGHKRPGSGDPNKPISRYPDFATARSRYIISPSQDAGEPFLMDYMAYHSLRDTGEYWTWKYSPKVFGASMDRDAWGLMGKRLVDAPGRKAIIHGQQSTLFIADSRRYICELGGENIPIVQIPEARHHLMLDQPLAFASAIAAFLAEWTVNRDGKCKSDE